MVLRRFFFPKLFFCICRIAIYLWDHLIAYDPKVVSYLKFFRYTLRTTTICSSRTTKNWSAKVICVLILYFSRYQENWQWLAARDLIWIKWSQNFQSVKILLSFKFLIVVISWVNDFLMKGKILLSFKFLVVVISWVNDFLMKGNI